MRPDLECIDLKVLVVARERMENHKEVSAQRPGSQIGKDVSMGAHTKPAMYSSEPMVATKYLNTMEVQNAWRGLCNTVTAR